MIVIIDDDPVFGEILKRKLHEYFKDTNVEINVLRYFDEDFLNKNYNDIEMLFLDIELEKENGIDLASKYREKGHNKMEIIFISLHDNFVHDVWTAYPLTFVRKSRLDYDLERCIKLIRGRTRRKNAKILVKNEMIKITDILYIKSQSNYVYYVLINGEKIRDRAKISTLEAALEEYNFMRCHLKYLINVAHIKDLKNDYVLLETERVSVSPSKYEAVMQAFAEYRFRRD
ncbi:LytR/AlgR family response regulator transcription factor [Thomasclavelia cocleata]|uniref:LytR/AlgR family response regulator transcription factor n=1 Tax=Thomasclavelia cocleata TaxID=69824 RepID=UPI00242AFA5D|nr:LytTR family DNA-binding domain-containing protein [Thomasclavelia cocleata]